MSGDAATVLAAAVAGFSALAGSGLTLRSTNKARAEDRREAERIAALERYRTVYTDFVAAITKCRGEAKARFDATGDRERHLASERFAEARHDYRLAYSRALMQSPSEQASAVHTADQFMSGLFTRMLQVNEGSDVTPHDRELVNDELVEVVDMVVGVFRADLDTKTAT